MSDKQNEIMGRIEKSIQDLLEYHGLKPGVDAPEEQWGSAAQDICDCITIATGEATSNDINDPTRTGLLSAIPTILIAEQLLPEQARGVVEHTLQVKPQLWVQTPRPGYPTVEVRELQHG